MSPKRTSQKRTLFKPMRVKVPFERTCIECHRALTTTFLYCAGGDCAAESRRKIRKQQKIGEYAKD